MTEKINELFKLASLNDFEFIYQNEGVENFIELNFEPKKYILINICDAEDPDLNKMLQDNINELNNRFN